MVPPNNAVVFALASSATTLRSLTFMPLAAVKIRRLRPSEPPGVLPIFMPFRDCGPSSLTLPLMPMKAAAVLCW